MQVLLDIRKSAYIIITQHEEPSMKKLPVVCPACQQALRVSHLQCPACGTGIEGLFDLPVLARLGDEDQDFALQFMLVSGSLKEMAQRLRLSYPTVRNRLDEIIQRCQELQTASAGAGADKGEQDGPRG
jgi:hypothetical protein